MISFQPQLASLSPKSTDYVLFLAAAPVGHDAPRKIAAGGGDVQLFVSDASLLAGAYASRQSFLTRDLDRIRASCLRMALPHTSWPGCRGPRHSRYVYHG